MIYLSKSKQNTRQCQETKYQQTSGKGEGFFLLGEFFFEISRIQHQLSLERDWVDQEPTAENIDGVL